MVHEVNIAYVAAQIGHPTRAAMLDHLLSVPDCQAGELARIASVSRSVASQHLRLLEHAGLIAATSIGRERWYRLSSSDVAETLESLARIAPAQPIRSLRQSIKTSALCTARTCYDHLAGRVGVGLTEALLRKGLLKTQPHDGTWTISEDGVIWLQSGGIDLRELRQSRRPLIRPCMDWSERRPHIAGSLGKALLTRLMEYQWVIRISGQRALRINSTVSINSAWDLILAQVFATSAHE